MNKAQQQFRRLMRNMRYGHLILPGGKAAPIGEMLVEQIPGRYTIALTIDETFKPTAVQARECRRQLAEAMDRMYDRMFGIIRPAPRIDRTDPEGGIPGRAP